MYRNMKKAFAVLAFIVMLAIPVTMSWEADADKPLQGHGEGEGIAVTYEEAKSGSITIGTLLIELSDAPKCSSYIVTVDSTSTVLQSTALLNGKEFRLGAAMYLLTQGVHKVSVTADSYNVSCDLLVGGVTSIDLDRTEMSVEVGESSTLVCTTVPAGGIIQWSTSDPNVATVSNGTVTGIEVGQATITATCVDKSATCTVTVTPATVHVTGVTLDKSTASIFAGSSVTLVATVSPSDAADKSVTWSSDDTDIATVDQNGVVTAVSVGSATITVTTNDGNKTVSCDITVSVRTYTVTFKTQDGSSTLESAIVNEGSDASFSKQTPAKTGDKQFTYTFAGWNTETNQESATADVLKNITSDKTVYAAFSKTINKYTIKFVDGDGKVIQNTQVEYGQMPAYVGGITPTKTATPECRYSFNGKWSPTIVTVTDDATYTAQFDVAAEKYTVTFKSQDGRSQLGSSTVNYGSAATFSGTTPTKPADAQYTYAFVGWNTESGKEIATADVLSSITADKTVYAAFSKTVKQYTVTFKSQDGRSTLGTTVVDYGSTAVFQGAEPTKDGTLQYTYTFAGWNVSANQETATADVLSSITANKTVYAAFSKTTNQYTVTFKSQDGSSVLGTETVDYGTAATFTGSEPSKDSTAQYTYTFVGWNASAGQESATSNVLKSITSDKTVYAAFSKIVNKYTVTFKSQDGSSVLSTSTVDYGSTASYSKTQPTKASTEEFTFAFAGWNSSADQESATADVLKNIIADKTVYAAFSKTTNQYTVTFKSQDGRSQLGTVKVDYGSTASFPGTNDPTKAATAQYTYTFAGWNSSADQESATADVLKNITADKTVYAAFSKTINQYTVTFKSQDGSTEYGTTTVDYGADATYTGSEPTKDRTAQYTHSFAGWNASAGQESATTNVLKNITADKTVYAAFSKTINQYAVTFKSQDGTADLGTAQANYGSTVSFTGTTPAKDPTAQYTYTFAGWNTSVNQESATTDVLKNITADKTVYAAFSKMVKQYTVTFKSQDGTADLVTVKVNYGSDAAYTKAQPTKALTAQYVYAFEGWNVEKDQTSATADILRNVTEDRTVYAAFSETVRTYSVKFVDGNGSTIQNTQVEYGQMPSYVGETPIKTATVQYTYTFNGQWTPEIVSVVGNATYTAQFDSTVNQYTVTFKSQDGSTILDSKTLDYGSTATYAGTEPTKDATAQYTYAFAGWSPSVNQESATADVLKNISADKTVYAAFSKTVNKYTVVWKNGDATVETDSNVEYGTMPTYEGNPPTKAATGQSTYAFIGWKTDTGAGIGTVQGDVTYFAQYKETINSYIVQFKSDGVILSKDYLEYGTVIAAPANPTKSATAQYMYAFSGWAVEGTTEIVTFGTVKVTSDVTYVAKYSENVRSYTIEWMNGDSSVKKETNKAYGSAIIKPSDPSKPSSGGYTYAFIGWNGYTDGMTVSGDVMFNAMYSSSVDAITGTGDLKYNTGADKVSLPIKSMSKTGVDSISVGMSEGTVSIDSAALATITTDVKVSISTVKGTDYTSEVSDMVGDNPVFSINMTGLGNTPITTFGDGKLSVTVPYELRPGQSVDNITVWCISGSQIEEFPAVYDAQKKTVTFVTTHLSEYAVVEKFTARFMNGADKVQETQIPKGAVIEAPSTIPTKESTSEKTYAFLRWDGYTPGMTISSDIVFNAVFYESAKGCTVVWKSGDSVISEQAVPYGSVIVAPENPAKQTDTKYSYVFKGWSGFTVGMTATGDKTFSAQYSEIPVKYAVKYILSGAPSTVTKPSDSMAGYGTSVTVNVPSAAGYAADVKLSDGTAVSGNRFVMPDHDVTVTITYTQSKYVISVTASPAEGGKVYGSGTYLYDADVSVRAVANTGYRFVSWDDGSTDSTRTFKATADASFTAMFVEDVVSVEKVSLDKTELSMKVGDTGKLTVTVEPYKATDKTVRWSSSDTSVVHVDKNGNINAISNGKATITVTSNDGGHTAMCSITVSSDPAPLFSGNVLIYIVLAIVLVLIVVGAVIYLRKGQTVEE